MSQTNITPINPDDFSTETYLASDENLITSNIEENQFDPNMDYIEFSIYDLNNNIIYPGGEDFSFSNYSLIDNEIYVDPEIDVSRSGITTGEVNVNYSFFRKRLNSSPQSTYYIKEISSDRTEIRLDSNIISKEDIISSTNEFVAYREADETFPDFYLNLGSNILFIANNIRLEENGTVLVKLYEPLPANIETKTSLWVVEKISEGLAYNLKFNNTVILPTNTLSIKGPNLNLSIKDEVNNPSEDTNLDLYTSPNSQSEYQISSYFADPSIKINVDYSDFSNFVNFSSAKARIENFWSKVSLIESASEQLAIQSNLNQTSAVSSSVSGFNGIINDTITNFDNYEYYLYFESSSNTYPKTNTSPPFENESTGSIVAQSWYNDKILEAENYDEFNYNWLKYSSPEYIQNDPDNDQYMTFLNMVGHFVDNDIWVYLKDTTNKWDADNRIDAGVSKDLIAQVLRDLGIKIYQNNYSSADLYSSFLGFTDSGSLFPFPYMTGSVLNGGLLETPQGYEYISNFISSSDEAIPLDDINKRIYKRIYHNLPYLLKSKGTVAGLRTLINSYGIPDTILRISEFGGKDRNNVNDWDLWKHQYNYAVNFRDTGHIKTKWHLNPNFRKDPVFNPSPQSLQFRFNAGPYSGSNGIAAASQSLFTTSIGGNPNPAGCGIVLEYDQDLAAIPSSDTYSGSILDPEYQYANLKFTVDNFVTSASIRLPFFNNDWWSVQVSKVDTEYTFYVGNKIYSGSDGSQIGFLESASFKTGNTGAWENNENAHFGSVNGSGLTLSTGNYRNFKGKYQEIRYFRNGLSGSVFNDYVMNPQSTEGNNVNSSPNELAFRASLGGELYTGSVSIHPKVSGPTGYPTSSFASDSNFTIVEEEFVENKEWVFYDSPAVGIKNRNTDKIKQQELILPSGNTLSNLGSIQQKSYTTQDYTNNLNLLEVAFSPQNQINDDIISQIGHFNIGDYIGDPRLVSSSANTYPSLVELSKEYFDKYSSNYDVYDYIRLIKFFDNSLFKMVKDFVPARTGIASGIVVKQHILERQKYPTPQAEWTQPEYTGSIGSTAVIAGGGQKYYKASTDFESNPIVTIEGGAGGSVNEFNQAVGFLRITNNNAGSSYTVNTTGVTLLTDSFVTVSVPGSDGKSIAVVDNVELGTGLFTNRTDQVYTSDIAVEFRNPSQPATGFTLQLIKSSTGEVITETTPKTYPIISAPNYNTAVLRNARLEPGESYSIFAKTTASFSQINRIVVNFIQLDAASPNRTGQLYSITNITPLGNINQVVTSNHEFYDGEYSGSVITTTDGELNTECNEFKEADTTEILYSTSGGFFENSSVFQNQQFKNNIAAGFVMTTGNKIYLQWGLDRTEVVGGFVPGTYYYYKIQGFAIEPDSLNGVDIENYLRSTNTFELLGINLNANSDFNFGGTWIVVNKTIEGPSNDVTLEKVSFRSYTDAATGLYYYVEVTTETEFKFFVPQGSGMSGDIDDITFDPPGTLNVLLSPFLPESFEENNCNPLYGNALNETPSTIYYDIDYSQGSITPVNFDTIIAGTADKAEIQDYNYFARRNIIPRYNGSKNTIGNYTTTGSGTYNLNSYVVNQFSGSNQPIERRDSIITEFEFGGGTYPEIYDGGGVQLRQHLFVGNTREDVNIQVTTEDGFIGTLKQTYPLNSVPTIQQYTTTSGNTVDARVAGHGFSVPSLASYMLPVLSPTQQPSNTLTTNGELELQSFNTMGMIVTPNSSGYYTTGSVASGATIYNEISESLASGNEWYITFYNGMPATLQGTLYPFTGTTSYYSQRNSRGEYIDPLKSRGVWKIGSVRSNFNMRYLTLEDSVSNLISSDTEFGSSSSNRGWLLWKAKSNSNLMVFVDATMSGVGKSGMTTDSPTRVIEQNFDYITRNFGSNTTTS